MNFVLFLAILFTWFYVNSMITEYLNVKLNMYSTEKVDKESAARAYFRLFFMVAASIFWTIQITQA